MARKEIYTDRARYLIFISWVPNLIFNSYRGLSHSKVKIILKQLLVSWQFGGDRKEMLRKTTSPPQKKAASNTCGLLLSLQSERCHPVQHRHSEKTTVKYNLPKTETYSLPLL
ncbi:MAG: hypothetical protein D3925_02010 [Candidatus Electrothrix sp. AR5]|nr:hypothetical protein [Candidatus Electrothrix sp. AR5]